MEINLTNFNAYDLFNKHWALITSGDKNNFNSCTISWGSIGNIWCNETNRKIITIYIHPARFTFEFLKKYDSFTVSFYNEEYKKSLIYMGTHSGKNEDKVLNSNLTPLEIFNNITYKEAKVTFICKKLYMDQFNINNLNDEIKDYYKKSPKIFPNVTSNQSHDNWEPHYMIIGEIIDNYIKNQ